MFRVCLPRQCGTSVFHVNTKLELHAIFSQAGPPLLLDCFAPLWEYLQKVSFPRTERYIVQFSNQTESRKTYDSHLAILSTEVLRR